MNTRDTVWHQPNVTIQNDDIAITDRRHLLKLNLKQVNKMYLSKRKIGYFAAIISQLPFLNESHYNLCIETKDHRQIRFNIRDFQRQYYIDLISRVRKKIVKTES